MARAHRSVRLDVRASATLRTMFRHAPPGYVCPFCVLVGGGETLPSNRQSDIIYRTPEVTAFVNARWWPNNHGHVLVIPNAHVENLYELSPELGAHVHEAARQVALAFKAVYCCGGVSTRQHNEPDGNQEVWHYRLHVFPRYAGDELYALSKQHRITTPDDGGDGACRSVEGRDLGSLSTTSAGAKSK
jgi:histidine triad (HIT) family protein